MNIDEDREPIGVAKATEQLGKLAEIVGEYTDLDLDGANREVDLHFTSVEPFEAWVSLLTDRLDNPPTPTPRGRFQLHLRAAWRGWRVNLYCRPFGGIGVKP